ncbi:MAG: hypothetical protein DMF52_15165, partial [Acidobacteria bacterium]
MTERASVLADAVPVARHRASLSPRKRQDQISASRDFICREEAEASYLASRPRPVLPVASKRRAGSRLVPRSGTLEGGRASSPVDSRPTYSVERSLLQADGLALSLRSALDRLAPLLARAAAAFVRSEAWSVFGFARLSDHARERFGRSARWVRDLATLGDALFSLPGLATALAGGDGAAPLGRVAALLVGRAATAASLAAWIALARSVSVRELRDAVRRARAAGSAWPPGADPDAGGVDESPTPAADSAVAGIPRVWPVEPDAFTATPAETDTQARGHLDSDDPGDDPADRSLVRIPVPAPLVAAFDEATDLYRAVEGAQASVTSFVEALVAEALAGGPLSPEALAAAPLPEPPESLAVGSLPESPDDSASDPAPPDGIPSSSFFGDLDRVSLRRGPDVARVEAALARATENWIHLPRSSPASWALHLAGAGLARLHDLSRSAGSGGPADLDAQIRELLTLEDDLERRLGRLLAEMAERGAWPRLRFGGAGHYAEERLGLSRTFAEDRARVARSLRRFPLLRAAYEEGRVGLEATLTVLRILGDGPVHRATESAWLKRAEEATVKRLRDEARALGPRGLLDRPAPPHAPQSASPPVPPPDQARTPQPDALAALQPRPLDDAEWHSSLRREPGTARERILRFGTLTLVWPDRAAEPVEAAGGPLPSPDVFLQLRLPDDLTDDLLSVMESTRRRLSDEVERVPWHEPWPDLHARPSTLAARRFSTRGLRVPVWVGLLALLEDFVFTWDGQASAPARQRAARVEPPSSARTPAAAPSAAATPRRHGDAIYIRDGWRCSAPACTSRRNLEDHHLVYRSHQGPDDLSNRVCLCR